MKTRRNIFAAILVFLISAFLISNAGHTAPPDYKTMPLHQVMAELKKTPDRDARKRIMGELIGRKPETQQDRDALYEALDSRHNDVRVYAIGRVAVTKEPRSIKKLVDNVKAIKTKSLLPMPITNTVERALNLLDDTAIPIASLNTLAELKNEEALPIMVDKLGEITQRGVMLDIALQTATLRYDAMSLPHVARRIEQLGDKQTIGKKLLLQVIINIKDKAGIVELRKLSDSNNIEIRTAAFRALGEMGEKPDLTRIFADIDATRANLKEYYKKTKGQNKPHNELDEDERLMSLESDLFHAIAASKNTAALPILEQRVDKEWKQRNFVNVEHNDVYMELSTIRDIGGPEAFAYLKRMYDEIPVKVYEFGIHKGKKNVQYKVNFLHYFNGKGFVEAIPFLEGLMNDSNEDSQIRQSAAIALSEITRDQKYYKIYKELEDKELRGGQR